jgi:hypothetical protein
VGKVTCLLGAMDGELMKNLRECECDDRDISSVETALKRDAANQAAVLLQQRLRFQKGCWGFPSGIRILIFGAFLRVSAFQQSLRPKMAS